MILVVLHDISFAVCAVCIFVLWFFIALCVHHHFQKVTPRQCTIEMSNLNESK